MLGKEKYIFFCRGLNPRLYIYYALCLLIESNSQGQMKKNKNKHSISANNNQCWEREKYYFVSIHILDN